MCKQASKKISVTLDGKKVTAEHRETVLDVARRFGVNIPTLCHHEALEPAGACRLCLVEVRQGDWRKFVTACNYPVWEGVEISTSTDEVMRHRKMTIETLLARSPEVPVLKELAAKMGVQKPRFELKGQTPTSCILCGLCTRVCEAYATSAISTIGRGEEKTIGAFAGEAPEECVGCGGCVDICPTGHIEASRDKSIYKVWDKETPIAVCGVNADLCRGCGACEEACPFKVPRVVLQKDAPSIAKIDLNVCKGCGVCVAACPSGAIEQPRANTAIKSPAKDKRALVITCGRADLKSPPKNVDVLELPCTGGVSQPMLLGALVSGYDGVLVLGRHEQTCRLNGAENHPKKVTARMDELLMFVGLGSGRVLFDEPGPGYKGPVASIEAFLTDLKSTPLKARWDKDIPSNMDGALEMVSWLTGRDELQIQSDWWLDRHDLPRAEAFKPALIAGAVPYLDLLLGQWVEPFDLPSVLTEGLATLKSLGVDAGIAVGGFKNGEDIMAGELKGSTFYSQCTGCGSRVSDSGATNVVLGEFIAGKAKSFKNADIKIAVGSEESKQLVNSLGCQSVDIPLAQASTIGLSLAINKQQRTAIEDRLKQTVAEGADILLLDGPAQLIQYMLTLRTGAWRTSNVMPVLASGLVQMLGESK